MCISCYKIGGCFFFYHCVIACSPLNDASAPWDRLRASSNARKEDCKVVCSSDQPALHIVWVVGTPQV